ncbi:MAG: undecaprenyl-phosphate glucose phosphotransferase [Lachnospiraceae bacterium]|nr:undecaprenyl-phosphate glucose phosphotransferase [Lachnospiraceae bacterium]
MIKENQRLLNLFHLVIDALIIVFSFCFAYHLRFDIKDSFLIRFDIINEPIGRYLSLAEYMPMLIYLIPFYIISYYIFGLYNPKRTMGRRMEIWALVKANAIGILYCTTLLYFFKATYYARLFLAIFFILNIVLDFIFRHLVSKTLRKLRRSGRNLKHVLLVGYGDTAKGYVDRILEHPDWGFYIHGILDDNEKKGTEYRGIKIVGDIDCLPKLLDSNEYDEIVITLKLKEYEKLAGIVITTEKYGVHTKFVPDYNNVIPTKPYTEDLEGLPVVHVRNVPLSDPVNKFLKRIFDIVGAIFCIIIFSIPMLIVSLLVKFTSPGPLIFKQKRIGLHNRAFNMYKFRSMRVQTASEEKKAWTTMNDPRVTPVGKFIRSTSLDELPQFFNVLKGDMSLVGPRPERPYFVDKFKEDIPRYMVKHQVRPGITGWAQVNGYRGDTSIKKRIDCDIYYIENWSLSLDIKILVLTLFKGFVNKNAY